MGNADLTPGGGWQVVKIPI